MDLTAEKIKMQKDAIDEHKKHNDDEIVKKMREREKAKREKLREKKEAKVEKNALKRQPKKSHSVDTWERPTESIRELGMKLAQRLSKDSSDLRCAYESIKKRDVRD